MDSTLNIKKRVCIAIPCLCSGGTEMQTLNLVRALNNAGYHTTVLCYFEHNANTVSVFKSAGSELILLNWDRKISAFRFLKGLKSFFQMEKPEIVHVQYMAPGALPILAAKQAGIKTILATVHQPWTVSHGIKSKLYLRLSAKLCNAFISVSKNAEISWFGSGSMFKEDLALDKQSKHFTIYNAVNVEKIQQIKANTSVTLEKQRLGINPNDCVIGAVARFTEEKGIDLLIQAFSLVLKDISNVHLLIVGTGPEKIKLKKLSVEMGIENKCTFYGEANWETAMQQMSLMDIVIVPSRFEGFGLTAAEGMSMAKPIIASEVYGLREIISNYQTGLLFPVEDIIALNKNIISLVGDVNARKSLGLNAEKKIKEQFDISIFNKKIEQLYNGVFNS